MIVAGLTSKALLDSADILADVTLNDGRHLVTHLDGRRHRLWLRPAETGDLPWFCLPAASGLEQRLAAVRRYASALGLQGGTVGSASSTAARYRRARLAKLLMLLDGRAAGSSIRSLAFGIVFPNHTPLNGAGWKGSSERRHTHRLLGEAQHMCRQGYRTLLEMG